MFSFAGDTVLDPFSGSGSTAVAAIRAGRNSISVEIEEEYLNDATRRAVRIAAEGPNTNHAPIVAETRSQPKRQPYREPKAALPTPVKVSSAP